MEMLGLPSQEGGGIGDELTASEEALVIGSSVGLAPNKPPSRQCLIS